jgi:hypothetical protein
LSAFSSLACLEVLGDRRSVVVDREVLGMDVLVERQSALDVHKAQVTACPRAALEALDTGVSSRC